MWSHWVCIESCRHVSYTFDSVEGNPSSGHLQHLKYIYHLCYSFFLYVCSPHIHILFNQVVIVWLCMTNAHLPISSCNSHIWKILSARICSFRDLEQVCTSQNHHFHCASALCWLLIMMKCRLGNLKNLGSWSSYKGNVTCKKLSDKSVSKEKY